MAREEGPRRSINFVLIWRTRRRNEDRRESNVFLIEAFFIYMCCMVGVNRRYWRWYLNGRGDSYYLLTFEGVC